ncbi:MAG: GNAT family N-acetyltransferase [Chloroflexi bacterium]|nr:GNAT family N-acetyltransferase [Chloroflexota bacterium]MDA8186792.1 GNAT family N-acetyltransferase [Dehalococcoidales bacterium]
MWWQVRRNCRPPALTSTENLAQQGMRSEQESLLRTGSVQRNELVEPVTQQNASHLRLCTSSRFTSQMLVRHIAENPDLAWKVRGENEYIVGGFWRHRAEIGHIVEMTLGRRADVLLSRLLDVFRDLGTKLVVVTLEDFSPDSASYRRLGLSQLDEIVEFERTGCNNLPPAAKIDIRGFAPQDFSAVLDVDHAAFPWLWRNSDDELRWYSNHGGVEIYVADGGSAIFGYAGLTINGKEGHLDRLAVVPDLQGKGLGAALLRFSIEQMARLGVRHVGLSTQHNNQRSQRLYRVFGFRPRLRSHKIYGLWLGGEEEAGG